jgi:transposase
MRGHDEQQEGAFSYRMPEERIPQNHPLRRIRVLADAALRQMDLYFAALYARQGRPSIAPERLLRALLLQVLYGIRSERLLMEQLEYNLLFRWFVGVGMDEAVWNVTVFTKNRDRLIAGEIAARFFEAVTAILAQEGLLSDEHFTVDGTLIEAWASRRSFVEKKDKPKRGSGARGRKLLRDTHESTTDADARLYCKSKTGQIKPSYLGHVVTENRQGLVVGACVTQSGSAAEREAALSMLEGMRRGVEASVGADKAYQWEDFISGLRERHIAPHVAEHVETKNWPNFLTQQEREHPGFAISQRKRKLVEKVFGWLKGAAGLRQTKFRGLRRVQWTFQLATAAYNLRRAVSLLPAR